MNSENHKNQLHKLTQQHKNAMNVNSQLKSQITKLQQQNEEMDNMVRRLETKIRGLEETNASLQKKNSSVEEQLAEHQLEIRLLNEERRQKDASIVIGEVAFEFCRVLLRFIFSDRLQSTPQSCELSDDMSKVVFFPAKDFVERSDKFHQVFSTRTVRKILDQQSGVRILDQQSGVRVHKDDLLLTDDECERIILIANAIASQNWSAVIPSSKPPQPVIPDASGSSSSTTKQPSSLTKHEILVCVNKFLDQMQAMKEPRKDAAHSVRGIEKLSRTELLACIGILDSKHYHSTATQIIESLCSADPTPLAQCI